MKTVNTLLITLFLSALLSVSVSGQESVVSTGGNIAGSDGEVSYTIGQVVYTTYQGEEVAMSQGVQQPFEVFEVFTSLDTNSIIGLSISVYPNPVSDQVILTAGDDLDTSGMTYCLYNTRGEKLQNEKLQGMHTDIRVGHLPSATYFIKVIQDDIEIKTIKIIKK